MDQGEFAHAYFELPEARIHQFLALLGHVILGILAEITHGSGFFDFFGEFVGELVFQRPDFVFKFFLDVLRHSLEENSSAGMAGESMSIITRTSSDAFLASLAANCSKAAVE